MLPLKEACGESIVVNMTEKNFLVAITEIDRYFGETSEFKDQARRFLKSNLEKIAQNQEAWPTFVVKFSALFQIQELLAGQPSLGYKDPTDYL